jgi:serine/threonine protein kinase
MEYSSSGELFDYIVKSSKLKETEACLFFQQILAGIDYIHKLGVVHRDLKPENLLLDHNKRIKIVDFGLSNTYKPDELLQTACGSPCYAAPEMIAGKKYDGLKVDIWSSGVILFAMVCGYLPFEDQNTGELYKKIMAGEYKIPKFVSSGLKDLLSGILNKDPVRRLDIEGIRSHSWYRQIKEELCPGILVGYSQIPVDGQILEQLEELNIDGEYVRQCLEANKHNSKTTAYYLLLKKHLKEGGQTISDSSPPTKKPKKTRSFSINLPEQAHPPPLFRLTQENLYRQSQGKGSQFHHRGNSTEIGRHSRTASMRHESPKTRINSSASPQRGMKKKEGIVSSNACRLMNIEGKSKKKY